ncbi:lysozyme inhibitor LprI family protein [Caballeronia sp. 15711]|uniref:lysozyme inhibitor LprI family protein n=1 Tax=Caballeronia sp. 15711 TaxID=3391029 RepID=UPI0039E719C7
MADAAAADEAAKVAQNAAATAEAASIASAAAALVADQKCIANLQCAGDKYNAAASIPCERMIETRARKIAKWDYKVEREHWYSPFTDSFSWTGASHQNITFHGDQAKFQNGFGAWQRQRYSCVFNIVSQKVTGAYFDMEGFEARDDATAGESAIAQKDAPPPATPDQSGTAPSADPASRSEVPVSTPTETITASFDCKKAHSTSEMLICGDANLAALDRDLATLYAQAKAAAPDKQAFAEMTRQNWNWRQRTCIDKTCLVTWYADQRQRFLNILNPPTQAAQEQGQVAPTTGAGPASFTTSFNCASVTFLDEKAICGDPGLAAMDIEMAATYAAAARTGDGEKLASDQRDWLAVRRDCASDLNCLRHAYGVRTDQLRRWHG